MPATPARHAVPTDHVAETDLRTASALFCADMLTALKQACRVPIAPFSVSGEYLRLRSEDDSRLLVELFTMLKRSGADQIITYAATDIARSLR
ncbi:MAG: hypothetical protein ACRDSF_03715 [Pseudonocardiaceae bacterium]